VSVSTLDISKHANRIYKSYKRTIHQNDVDNLITNNVYDKKFLTQMCRKLFDIQKHLLYVIKTMNNETLDLVLVFKIHDMF